MHTVFLRGTCDDNRTCPAIHRTDRSTYVVQGYPVGRAGVEVPVALLPELSEAWSAYVTRTDHSTYVIHGVRVTDPDALADLDLPAGEDAVEVAESTLPGLDAIHAR